MGKPNSHDEQEVATAATPDGGWGWVVLLAAFVTYFIADGWSYTFSLFFPEFLHHFQATHSQTAAIGAMVYGVPRLVSPVISIIINICGCRVVAMGGGVITGVAFILSAFATSIDNLCITLGLLASVGFATVYITSLVMVTFYFKRRRGLATGLATTGSGLGAFTFPLLMEMWLSEYSWRNTLLLLGGISFHIIVAGALFRPPPFKIPKLSKINELEIGSKGTNSEQRNFQHPLLDTEISGDSFRQHSHASINTQQSYLTTAMSSSSNSAFGPMLTPNVLLKQSSKHLPTDISTTAGKENNEEQCRTPGFQVTRFDDFPKSPNCSEQRLTYVYSSNKEYCQAYSEEPDNTGRRLLHKMCYDMKHTASKTFDTSLLTNKSYLLYCVSSFIFYFFVVVPYVYLVDRVCLQGYSANQAAMLLSVIGISRTLGQIILGSLGDLPKVNSLVIYSLAIASSGIGTLLIPLCPNYNWLCACCGVFGFAISVIYVLQMICIVQMVGLPKATFAFGLFQLIPGVATLIGAPIAGFMYEASGDYDLSFYVAGSLIFLSGCVILPLPLVIKAKHNEDYIAPDTHYTAVL